MLQNKLVLMGLLFLASALVMFIEIIGAKFLTPIVGGNHVAWICQITVTLLSLSLGAYLSSKFAGMKKLGWAVLVSAVLFTLALFFNFNIKEVTTQLPLALETLVLSLVFYSVPLTALGMTFPTITKILYSEHKLPLGVISAWSTLGSVVGTAGSYFAVLLGSNLFLLTASSFTMILFGFLLLKKTSKTKYLDVALLAIIVVGGLVSNQKTLKDTGEETVLFKNTHFGEFYLIKKDGVTSLYNDGLTHNAYNEKKESVHLFSYALRVLPESVKPINSALILGLGIGFVAKDFVDKGVTDVEAVEINPDMIQLSKDILNLDIKVFDKDAKVFLKKNNRKYDLVVHDAFLVDGVVKHLITKETFEEIKGNLNEGGILSMNSFGVTSPNDYVTNATYNTLKSVFKNVRTFSLNKFNVFFIASDGPLEFTRLDLAGIPEFMHKEITELVHTEVVDFKTTKIMQDNSNWIELYDNSPREMYRKQYSWKN